jgi:hypothetical protein
VGLQYLYLPASCVVPHRPASAVIKTYTYIMMKLRCKSNAIAMLYSIPCFKYRYTLLTAYM